MGTFLRLNASRSGVSLRMPIKIFEYPVAPLGAKRDTHTFKGSVCGVLLSELIFEALWCREEASH